MNTRPDRPWYLLTGLVIGLVLGVSLAWLVIPPLQPWSLPASLREDFKDQYRLMISAAYAASGNIERARARLAFLGDSDPAAGLILQAGRMQSQDSSDSARALSQLAQALKEPAQREAPTAALPSSMLASATPPPTAEATIIPSTSAPSQTAAPSATTAGSTSPPVSTLIPRPTRQATPTPGAPFALIASDALCDPALPPALLQVIVRNAASQPVPGVELIITWNAGEESFFTGLKPELGNGYADYQMTPGVVYILRVAESGTTVPDLSPPACSAEDGQVYPGTLRLIFQQP